MGVPGATMEEAAGIARVRADVYRILSGCLLPPDAARLEAIRASLPEIRETGRALRGLMIAPAWTSLEEVLQEMAADPERHVVEYTSLFLSGSLGRGVSPYESSWALTPGDPGGPLLSAAVETVYRKAGLVLGNVAGGELPDHIAIELDFLGVLCRRESAASERGDAATVTRWRAVQRAFLGGHLARWIGPFATRVSEVFPGGSCAAIAHAARTFVEHDVELLRAVD